MKRVLQLFAVAALGALLVPALASAAPRMHIGFHDDPNFRYEERRTEMLDQVRSANATIIRTLVTWSIIAPTRPANASDPFDKAYRFNDLDELVRNTQERDMEVLITIWGTPKWANGGKTPNFLPTRIGDLTAFARAVASRYSGRYPGFPYVRFYSIWNESNLQLFLAPQFDAKGRSVGPRNYARLAAAGYAGIKAGNPSAKVAIGSTSSAGRDKPLKGKSATHSPGRFARLVAAANPRLKFDAWAQHPYPVPANQKPLQKVKWPNVTLSAFPRFGAWLDNLFGTKVVAVSDSKGGIYDEKGLDCKAVTEHKVKTGAVHGFKGSKSISNDELIGLNVDVLLPSALENAITKDNACTVKAKIVAELANGPTTPEADAMLHGKGCFVIPDFLCNAGGVTVSYFEQVQNASLDQWKLSAIHQRLDETMTEAFDAVWQMREKMKVHTRLAAYLVAIQRVADACRLRGWIGKRPG